MSVNASRLIGFLLLVQTLFVGSTFRTALFVAVVSACLGLIIYVRRRLMTEEAPSKRSRMRRFLGALGMFIVFAGLVAITAAWRIGSQFSENMNYVYVGTDTLAHAALFASLTVWAFRPRRGHMSMLPLGLSVVLLCVAAGGASLSLAAQTTVALGACIGFSLASQILLGSANGHGGTIFTVDRSATSRGRPGWMGPLFSLLTLSILMMATTAIANGTNWVLPSIQEKLKEHLQTTFDPVAEDMIIGGTRYVRGSKLGVIRKHMLADPQSVALKVYCNDTPGYFRGHAMDLYRDRRWYSAGSINASQWLEMVSVKDRTVAPVRDGTTKLNVPLAKPLKRFPLVNSTVETTINLEIHNDPIKGPMVFLPAKTRWVEASSRELVVGYHGIVHVGVDTTKPYVAGVGFTAIRETLDPNLRVLLLDVPESVAADATQIADQVCASLPTAKTKAAAISNYFQTGFGYSMLPTRSPRDVDPLAHFLRTKHDAHCEYFASATVMVLRSAGVPARYVTGYVADEASEEEDSLWLARNRDAHAWAEAYDDKLQQWFPVESTPGRRYHTIEPESQDVMGTGFFDGLLSNSDDDNETWISQAIGWILSMRATDPLSLIFRIAQLPLFCVLLFLLWTKYIRPAGNVDPVDQKSRAMLRKVDRKVRKHALIRTPSETLYQFADRIDKHHSDVAAQLRPTARALLRNVSRWYRDYANARYQGELPTPLDVR